MMHHMESLVRRGVDAAGSLAAFRGDNDGPEQNINVSPWALLLLGNTILTFACVSFAINYTYQHVVAILTTIESSSGILFEPISSTDPDYTIEMGGNKKPSREATEALLVPQPPITAKFRTTILHLRAQGGCASRFRGLSLWIVMSFMATGLMGLLSVPLMPRVLTGLISSVVLARLRLTWLHIVISAPSPLPWYRRLATWGMARKTLPAVALLAVCEQITLGIPMFFFSGMAMDKMDNGSPDSAMVCKSVALLTFSLFSALALVLPAWVTLVRVQASLLPEDVETIVPFDRSFGGRLIPEIVGGSGVIGLLDSWRTFDKMARLRLVKVFVKVFVMQTALAILCFALLATEMAVFVGQEDVKGFLRQIMGDRK